MLEIGKSKTYVLRGKDRKPKLDASGAQVTVTKAAIVKRVTRKAYGHNSRYTKKLVVVLEPVDLVAIKPLGACKTLRASVYDIYLWMARTEANKTHLEKARDRKARKIEQRASRRVADADRRLRIKLKKERQTT